VATSAGHAVPLVLPDEPRVRSQHTGPRRAVAFSLLPSSLALSTGRYSAAACSVQRAHQSSIGPALRRPGSCDRRRREGGIARRLNASRGTHAGARRASLFARPGDESWFKLSPLVPAPRGTEGNESALSITSQRSNPAATVLSPRDFGRRRPLYQAQWVKVTRLLVLGQCDQRPSR